jgi:hypothetical protein
MSKAALSDFLLASAKHLGLDVHHGDTESTHPYVSAGEMVASKADAIIMPKEEKAPAVKIHNPVNNLRHPTYGDAVTRRYAAQRENALRGLKP